MYKTRMPHTNVLKKLQREEIQLCEIFLGTLFLFGRVEASRWGGWCSVRTGGRPGAWILEVMIWRSHVFTDLSYWPHMYYT